MVDRKEVVAKMSRVLGQPVERLREDADLTELVADSFALIHMVMEIQEEFDVRLDSEHLRGVRTVGGLSRLVESLSRA